MPGKWTSEQEKAITTRNKNLLVSAAAGSGKTAVLIERILSLITDNDNPVPLDKLLVVTFTRAAAAEMKGRLRERLINMQAGGQTSERQLALLPTAQISTFDSLCQTIVRENFTELNIDPSFITGDEDELHVLREQALDAVFEESYENDDFRALVESVCESADDYELRGAVLGIYGFIQSVREPEKWLMSCAESYNINASRVSETFFGKAAFEYAQNELRAALKSLKRSMEAAEEENGPQEYIPELSENKLAVEAALTAVDYEQMSALIGGIVFGGLKPSRCEDTELRAVAQAFRDDAKVRVLSLKDKYFFKSPDGILNDAKAAYPAVKTLCETVLRFAEKYMELKSEKRLLSFSDIKLLCFRALANGGSDAANAYRERYSYVMVDEYQDTNDVEEGILEALSSPEKGNRFMVGDVKQSIYRFRQAKPELFIEKSELYGADGVNSELISLHKNFRSRAHILSALNFVFSQIMRRVPAEIEYDESQRLVPGADYEETGVNTVEIALIETDKSQENAVAAAGEQENAADNAISPDELNALEVEALYIADKIYELIYEKKTLIQDGDSLRPAKLSDIVVLMRSGKKKGALVSDMLGEKGIPSFTEGKTGWFELTEISDMLSLLQIIDNPLQEIPLLTVLTSPVYRFTPDELVEIRSADEKGWFYAAISKYAQTGANEPLKLKAAAFIEKLAEYRSLARRTSVSELLTFLYDDTGYTLIAGAMENGRLRRRNLQNLARRAAEYEKTTFTGLFHFVRYMERLKANNSLQSPVTGGEGEDAVRIMTIHKSRGLEFPIVFLAGCGSPFNLRDLNGKFLLHQELGFGVTYVDYEKRTKTPTLQRSIIAEALRRESLAEEMRLMYVAMTRAKEMLFITGGAGRDVSRRLAKWRGDALSGVEAFPPETISSARCYLDWLMPAAMKSESAQVFLEEYGLCVPVLKDDGTKFAFTVVKRSETVTTGVEAGRESEALETQITSVVHIDIEHSRSALERASLCEGEVPFNILQTGSQLLTETDIDKLMNWKYNYETDTVMPVKLTVSEIKTRFQSIISGEAEAGPFTFANDMAEIELHSPDFVREKRLTPAEKGTAAHTVLANVDFAQTKTESDIRTVMDGLLIRKILAQKEYDSVNIADILTFMNSDIAQRIRCSSYVRREIPFVIALTSEEAYLPPSAETILVHGIIDCFFEENGGIVIIDYKTDYVRDGDFESVRQKYKTQLDIYRNAAGKITGKPVKAALLYMLRYGKLIEM